MLSQSLVPQSTVGVLHNGCIRSQLDVLRRLDEQFVLLLPQSHRVLFHLARDRVLCYAIMLPGHKSNFRVKAVIRPTGF